MGVRTISWLSVVSECTWSDYSWTDTEQDSRFGASTREWSEALRGCGKLRERRIDCGEFDYKRGDDTVKERKLQMLTSQFKNIQIDESEPFDEFYARRSDIVNTSAALGVAYSNVQIVSKVLRSLPKSFRSRRDAIEEVQDLKKMKPDTLAGKF
ncbi:hypothetical protein GIB67_004208 [Kingdonia uniflora]|uniref:Uncharacterized protein n=1 Tax=Kingdonia uniflora TaxID=39325 RepID=A0A7J7P0Z3_9MAGN|nr:hypothetical protein GIB67_004208 [Kingdonia uniflora]